MAAVLPRSITDLVAFMEARLPAWTLAPTDLGLTAAAVASIQTQLNDVKDKIVTQATAYTTARAATSARDHSAEDLRRLAAEAVAVIKAFAATQAKPNAVYDAAGIPEPLPPAPAPAPEQPENLRIAIDPVTGALTLAWKASNHGLANTSYIVRRKAAGESAFAVVGLTAEKSFTDATFLAGPDSVEYSVQATRGGKFSLESGLLVRFGIGGSFTATALGAPKLAA